MEDGMRDEVVGDELTFWKERAASLETACAEANKRLLVQVNKHAKATAKIAELVRANAQCAELITGQMAKEVALVKVWSWLWKSFVQNPGLEYGDEFQELGEKVGLLHQVPYDPEKHGQVEQEPGEPIYVLTDLGKACFQEPIEEA